MGSVFLFFIEAKAQRAVIKLTSGFHALLAKARSPIKVVFGTSRHCQLLFRLSADIYLITSLINNRP